MTGYCAKIQATTHQSRHYESCLNSTCSRSPSPIRRQLWEPKHPPSPKLKSNQKLPLKPFYKSKQSSNQSQNRDKSPFLPPPRDLNGASTPNRCRDPLFTYTVKEGPLDIEYRTKKLEIKIQRHRDSSRPSSGNRTPEQCMCNPPLKDQVAAENLKLELVDTSRVPPTVTTKNNTTVISAQQPVQLVSSTPVTTCPKSHPCSSSSCFTQQQCPCSPRQNTEPCDLLCRPCSCRCPYLSSPRSNLKEDKATSPAKPSSTPSELEPCLSVCQVCPKSCPYTSSCTTTEDKAISPINPRSRSASPCPQRSSSPNSIHGYICNGSDKSSEGTIEVKFEDGSEVRLDWEGNLGPIHVDLPVTDQSRRSDDQVHNYDPQLEAFYTSSYNQSRSPSTCKSRSVSPSPAPSERPGSRSRVPCSPCYPCALNNYDSSSEAQLASICTSRSPCSPSTSYSRSPQSKSASKKELSRNNSFGSIEIRSEGGEIITNIDWSSPISNVDTHNPFSKPENFDCRTEEQSLSPMLTVNPNALENGHVTFEWSPRSAHENRCKETSPLVLSSKTPREDYEDFRPSYYPDEVGKEESQSSPKVIPQVFKHPCSPNFNSEYETCMESKNFSYTSSCKLPCTLNHCPPTCDPCQGSSVGCDGCCCCCNKNCMAPSEGINECTSLPPHLQSDWSASLRCPPGELRTKPILYRDTEGHEHIMFADGSIEHLSRQCEPTTSTPPQPSERQPSPPLSPPSYCQNLFHREVKKFDPYANSFSPQSGDIVIRAHQRLPCMYPGKDNGQVAFFTSDYLDLQEGDSIVRLGKFDQSGEWCSSDAVEMYLRGSHGQWTFLGSTDGHSVLCPLEADRHQAVRTPHKQLKLRRGDLVISTLPSPNSFYFWNPNRTVEVDHSHLLLRAYIGHPQVVDENHNLACCVAGHLPVGYVELYVKVKRIWLFLGRDDHMFTEHELMHFS